MKEDSPTELFSALLDKLTWGDPILFSLLVTPPWFEEDQIYEIDEEIYQQFLNEKPRRWVTEEMFVVEEQPAPCHIFWVFQGKYFTRKLSIRDSTRFRLLSTLSYYE